MKIKAKLSPLLLMRIAGKGHFREEIALNRIAAKKRRIKRRRKMDGYYINGKA